MRVGYGTERPHRVCVLLPSGWYFSRPVQQRGVFTALWMGVHIREG